MRALVVDLEGEGTALDMALRGQRAGHDVRYWQPPHPGTGKTLPYGQGMLPIVTEWESSADWADLIIVNGNSRSHSDIADYLGRGYPMFATNERTAQLELDREAGMKALEEHGIEVPPYTIVESVDDAIEYIVQHDEPIALKCWGGTSDKASSYVSDSPEDAIFWLKKRVEKDKADGRWMLQQKIEGIEVAVAGWFGPGGWSSAIEENFEHKKLMNDNLGPNTGEQGTVIRHVTESKLFDLVLEPLGPYLQELNYTGDVDVNCIVDKDGKPWPLEFTCRFGIPDIHIRYALLRSDPLEWMLDLLRGEDSFIVSPQIAVGVVLSHGTYPHDSPLGMWEGYPIHGVTGANEDSIHWAQVRKGRFPVIRSGKLQERSGLVTAGMYVAVVTGIGDTVKAASRAAYEVADAIRWPSDVMYRTDIGERLKDELPQLQKHGFLTGMEFE
jgi:phosphoribosylamine---glycine ligase